MKKVALLLVTIPLLLFALNTNSLADGVSDVVVVVCRGTLGIPGGITPVTVFNASSSAGAPAVTTNSCAQALADLLSAGFEIANVQPAGGFEGGASYTLLRKQ